MLKIEKDVPIPTGRSGRRPLYPFAEMEVGDSFFIETTSTEESRKRQMRLSDAWSRHHPKKFTSSAVDGGVRVWRIE